MSDLLGGAKLPKMDALKKQRRELAEKKKPSMRNTARPRRICGRPWRSRGTSTVCSATRTSGTRPRSDSAGAADNKDFWTKCPEVRRVWGAPNKHFAGPAPCKNFGVWPHPNCLPFSGTPEKPPKNEKNEGPFYLTSVSLAFCSPSAVASMTVNSFSSIVLSSLSICWRQSLSPFCLSG